MPDDLLAQAINLPFETFYLIMALGMLRFIGFSYGFIVFGWGMGTNLTLRVGVSFVLSLPIMIVTSSAIEEFILQTSPLMLVLISVKEFALGLGLGLLASSPFRSLEYAGAIIDTFRGENNGGISTPDGGQLTTLANYFFVIGVYVFVGIGGFLPMIAIVYETFSIWPIDQTIPVLYVGSAMIVLEGISKALQIALVMCAPLMILMMAVEFVLIISAKLGRRFGLYNMSFVLKNLIVVLSLPTLAVTMVTLSEHYTQDAILSLKTLKLILE